MGDELDHGFPADLVSGDGRSAVIISRRLSRGGVVLIAFALLMATVALACAQESPPPSVVRQSLNDAWWTGPLLANSAATLPRGHFLIEPYLYDVIGSHANSLGSRAYVLYGLVDKLTVGFIPIVGYNLVSDGPSSSRMGFGDFTPLAQYRLTQFHEGSWIPSSAIMVQQTLPTGEYDQLDRPSDGFGSGAYTTTILLNTQTYFWMPNGRILRMRLNVEQAFSSGVKVQDVSVYGTQTGFRGHANPGSAFLVNAAWEYSLTQKWVPALDAIYHQTGNTSVLGYDSLEPGGSQNVSSIRLDSGSSAGFGFAPAIEYNWTRNLGVIFGARIIDHGRNTAFSITPAVAINFVH
jgi:hypothetical protein